MELANNNMGAQRLFKLRQCYKDKLYPNLRAKPIDTWYEKPKYGLVDTKGSPIYINEAFLRQLKNPEKTVFALDFVAYAFEEMRESYLTAFKGRRIDPENTVISDIKPHNGWRSVLKDYNFHMEKLYASLSSAYLRRYDRKIQDFAGFVEVLLDFKKLYPIFPFTFTGFLESKFNNPLTNGLTIDIASGMLHGDDAMKKKWLEDMNYNFYVDNALQHGFTVDKNAPWRLVADVTSPAMKKYLELRGITPENVFSGDESRYLESAKIDGDFLLRYLFDFYNSYVKSFPETRKRVVKDGRTVSEKVLRNSLTRHHLGDTLNHRERLIIYTSLRASETGKEIRKESIERALDIMKAKNLMMAIRYINESLKVS